MNKRQISIFLIILMLMPIINTVQADGDDEYNLEAKNITAIIDSMNETVTIVWDNIDTNDYLILEELKTTNYSLYRSDEPLNDSNYLQSELISGNIQACLESDSLTVCKNRQHSVVYNTPPNTDGSFYYGVISTLDNGSIIDNFSPGNASLSEPVHEFGSAISSPYSLQANYNVENSTTTLNWIDVSQVDSTINSIHTTLIWSHSVKANRSNWESLNKVEVAFNLTPNINTYQIIHPENTSQINYYSVMHLFDGESDSRLLSGNTLTNGLTEDNIGSLITGTLQAEFNSSNSNTALNWSGSIIEDANHSLHIWRSSSEITDVHSERVEEIAQLPANSTHYNFTVQPGYSGESYYMITLSDQIGNHQTNLSAAPSINIYEFTLTANENIVTDLSASHSMGVTQLTWTDIENHSEAIYQIWYSTTGQINVLSNAILLATVQSGIQHYNYTIADGLSQESWYAITAIASFGTQNFTYPQTNISISLNSLSTSISEDTKEPIAPSTFDAEYLVNGSTKLTWIGDGVEQGTTWKVYRNLYTDLNEESFWVKVAEIENSGASQHTVYVNSVANVGEVVIPAYAIGGEDLFGNSIAFESWVVTSTITEDRQKPVVQLKLYDSQTYLETSRWFNGGESAKFSNLEADNYTLRLVLSDDVDMMNYSISTNNLIINPNIIAGLVEFDLQVSNQTSDVTITFSVSDITGNTITFDTLFCTSCLIKSQGVNQTDNQIQQTEEVTEEKSEGESKSNDSLLIGICAILVLIIIFMMTRGSKSSKSPTGIPSKSEDQWIDKYIKQNNE